MHVWTDYSVSNRSYVLTSEPVNLYTNLGRLFIDNKTLNFEHWFLKMNCNILPHSFETAKLTLTSGSSFSQSQNRISLQVAITRNFSTGWKVILQVCSRFYNQLNFSKHPHNCFTGTSTMVYIKRNMVEFLTK